MNKKEIREIKRRFSAEHHNFTHIYGCYVTAAKDIIATMELPTISMEKEELEMYMGLLKKSLSGVLGRNLVNIEFATYQVGVSDEHRLLQSLRMSALKDENMRNLLYQRIIDSTDMDNTSYVILLAADAYDVPYKQSNDEEWSEDSTDEFDYIVCCLCPVKDSKAALRYFDEERQFRGTKTGSILSAPTLGFMFPTFDDRATNIYNVLYYSKSSSMMHEDFIRGVFNTPKYPMAAEDQQVAFGGALEALEDECSLAVVQSLHSKLRENLEAHKESHSPDAPSIDVYGMEEILRDTGVSEGHINEFSKACKSRFDDMDLNPSNIMNNKRFEISTPEAKVTVDPDQVYSIRTEIIDGREYLLIPMSEGVTVNGIEVTTKGSAVEATEAPND